jgi:hypothetical protein
LRRGVDLVGLPVAVPAASAVLVLRGFPSGSFTVAPQLEEDVATRPARLRAALRSRSSTKPHWSQVNTRSTRCSVAVTAPHPRARRGAGIEPVGEVHVHNGGSGFVVDLASKSAMPTPATTRARPRFFSMPATLRSSITIAPWVRTRRVVSWCSPSRRAFATRVCSVAMRAWSCAGPGGRRSSSPTSSSTRSRGSPDRTSTPPCCSRPTTGPHALGPVAVRAQTQGRPAQRRCEFAGGQPRGLLGAALLQVGLDPAQGPIEREPLPPQCDRRSASCPGPGSSANRYACTTVLIRRSPGRLRCRQRRVRPLAGRTASIPAGTQRRHHLDHVPHQALCHLVRDDHPGARSRPARPAGGRHRSRQAGQAARPRAWPPWEPSDRQGLSPAWRGDRSHRNRSR